MPKINNIKFGCDLLNLKTVNNLIPSNQGKPIHKHEIENIYKDYCNLISKGKKKKDASIILQDKYQRGKFSIKNILDKFKTLNKYNAKSQTPNKT